MLSTEKTEFLKMLRDLFTLYDKDPEPRTYELWWSALSEFDLSQIRLAMSQYAKKNKYAPVPAGVIEFIPQAQEISADEAWAHVPKSEYEGGWITNRMASALGQVSTLMDNQITARKSFIAAYNNLPDDNEWFYSPAQGLDYDQQLQNKIDTHRKLEAKQWITNTKKIDSLLIENGSKKTLNESNRLRVQELLSTIHSREE